MTDGINEFLTLFKIIIETFIHYKVFFKEYLRL